MDEYLETKVNPKPASQLMDENKPKMYYPEDYYPDNSYSEAFPKDEEPEDGE